MFSPYKHDLRIAVAQTSIVDIVQAQPATGSRELSRIAAQLVAEPWLWWPRVRYQASQRFYTRVCADETYEAWLLTWLPGQSTGLHDHGGSSGAFVVAKGVLTETTVSPDGGHEMVRTLSHPRVRTFGESHVHDVANLGRIPAISLHVYAPALTTMRRYERIDEQLRQVSEETAGAAW
jgi:predicted metal-dependent enzyme (double-stranded beta helix superfamily)